MISVKDIILQSWNVYEKNFKTIIKIIVWSFAAMAIASIGVFLVEKYFTGHFIAKGFLNFLVNVPQIIVALWVSIVLIDFLNNLLDNKKEGISKSISKAFKIFLPVLLLSIVVGMIETIGFVLLIIPGLILTVWLAFAVYEMVLGNKNFVNSIKESKKLSEKKWFAVAWRYFVPSLFWAIAGWFATYILVFATKQLLYITKTDLDSTATEIMLLVLSVAENAFYVFFVPPILASVLILYRNLKEEK